MSESVRSLGEALGHMEPGQPRGHVCSLETRETVRLGQRGQDPSKSTAATALPRTRGRPQPRTPTSLLLEEKGDHALSMRTLDGRLHSCLPWGPSGSPGERGMLREHRVPSPEPA